MKISKKQLDEFIKHNNYIEGVDFPMAHEDGHKAWEWAFKNMFNINANYILRIHKILMNRVNPRIAGKTRNCDVWIGGHKKLFINKYIFQEQLNDLSAKILKGDMHPKDAHILFESIHPFEDGNGRVGRILMNIHRLRLNLPILIIHAGKEQEKYYDWFI